MFDNIVVGSDGSPTALEAVRYAIELARLGGGRLHIVTAFKKSPMQSKAGDEFAVGSVEAADSLLEDLGSRARIAGVDVKTHAASEEAADVLIDVAKRENADVIVVGNRGMRGARRILGSVPNSIAHNAPCAVLIVNTLDMLAPEG